MAKYATELALARALSRCTENLRPPQFVPVDDALQMVRRALHATFLPLEDVDGPAEHALFAVFAALTDARRRRIVLRNSDLVRLYTAGLKAKHATLDQEEAAFLRRLGLGGVHIFDSGKPGEP